MKTSSTKQPLWRLLRHMRQHRQKVFLATVCSILNKTFDLAPPILIGAAVDIVVSQENSFIAQLGITNVLTQLWILAGLTLLAWGLESAFEYAYSVLWRNLAQHLYQRHTFLQINRRDFHLHSVLAER